MLPSVIQHGKERGKEKRMMLSQKEISDFINWLEEHAKKRCESCQNDSIWHIGDNLMMPNAYQVERELTPYGSLPMFYIVCSHCGHVRLYSALAVQILPNRLVQKLPLSLQELRFPKEIW